MVSNLLVRIDMSREGFSKGQRRIANFIEEHYDEAAFMTANKLGEIVGVSESTVVRFATEIGYSGYPSLQKAMQEMIRDKLTSIQRIEVTTGRIGDKDVLCSVLNQDIEKIKRTIEEISMGMSGPRNYGKEEVLKHAGYSTDVLKSRKRNFCRNI